MKVILQDVQPGELEANVDRLCRALRSMAGDTVEPEPPIAFVKAAPGPPHLDQEPRSLDLHVLDTAVQRARKRHVERIQKRMLKLMLDTIGA